MKQNIKHIFIFIIIFLINYSVSNSMNKEQKTPSKSFVFIYSHGFNSAGVKSQKYIRHEILPNNTLSFNYDDAKRYIKFKEGIGLALGLHKSAIGQINDVQKLSEQIDQIESYNIILFGESRGASTIINYLGSKLSRPDKIKAVVLDSPFDQLLNVISHRLNRLHLSRFIKPQFIEKCFCSISKNYKLDGIQPIKSVSHINQTIPILFICSQEDKSVPWISSLKLYKNLILNNHQNAHILILPHGKHACLTDGECKNEYRAVIHAFFKKYGAPYNAEHAELGEKDLFNTQPDIKQINYLLSDSA